ncbi:MAG TPA: hypothetical protein VLA73_10085 [Burkholderiales bacterium]|nr:hypothetical protein [Burkholderiales bacterium]
MSSDIARFYQQCDPAKPLPHGDERYVFPAEGTRGEGDAIAQITNAIRWSDTPLHLLFAGHRGGGKSTELLRLWEALANPPDGEAGFFVVYFEADEDDIDVNDADLPDLLLAIIRQVGKALREQLKIELKPTWLNRFLDDLKALLGSKVSFEKVELDAKIAKFTAAIKSSPDERRRIREALEPNVSSLLSAANELLQDAVLELKARGYANLVVIVDNLDRIVLRDVPGSAFNTQEQLFINRGAQLAHVDCHILYTLPISMVFSPRATALVNVFGRQPTVLPMIKVTNREGGDSGGLPVLRELVQRRLNLAGTSVETASDSADTLDYLCRMSGGHFRNFLILLRSACTAAGAFPLTRAIAERVVRGMSTDFERALNATDYFDVLRQVDQNKELPGSPHDQLLLYNLSILEYVNAAAWYAVNPAVRLLEKFAPRPTARTRKPRRKG